MKMCEYHSDRESWALASKSPKHASYEGGGSSIAEHSTVGGAVGIVAGSGSEGTWILTGLGLRSDGQSRCDCVAWTRMFPCPLGIARNGPNILACSLRLKSFTLAFLTLLFAQWAALASCRPNSMALNPSSSRLDSSSWSFLHCWHKSDANKMMPMSAINRIIFPSFSCSELERAKNRNWRVACDFLLSISYHLDMTCMVPLSTATDFGLKFQKCFLPFWSCWMNLKIWTKKPFQLSPFRNIGNTNEIFSTGQDRIWSENDWDHWEYFPFLMGCWMWFHHHRALSRGERKTFPCGSAWSYIFSAMSISTQTWLNTAMDEENLNELLANYRSEENIDRNTRKKKISDYFRNAGCAN